MSVTGRSVGCVSAAGVQPARVTVKSSNHFMPIALPLSIPDRTPAPVTSHQRPVTGLQSPLYFPIFVEARSVIGDYRLIALEAPRLVPLFGALAGVVPGQRQAFDAV